MKRRIAHFRTLAFILILCLVMTSLMGCGIGSQHLEVTYEKNENEDINSWEDVDDSSVTTWDDAAVVTWDDIDEFSDWVYAEILFEEITEDMPIVECRVLNYQSNGKYFDGEKVYKMVGDKFDVNSFVAKYAVGTGVIVICVVLTIVTAGVSTPITCFIAGAADASISMAIKGAAFGAATKAIIRAIKSGGDFEEALFGALEGSADGYMWGAIYGAATGGFKNKFCFAKDTLVLTECGERKISEIHVGDSVYAYDENTGTYAFKPVTQISLGETTETIRVQIDGEIIECTPTHPFLTDFGWIPASELEKGNQILSKTGSYRTVTAIDLVRYAKPISTYTLCVDDYHSFLVGKYGVVVHNRCKPNGKYANETRKFPEGSELAAKYPDGVPFDANGYPIFDQYAVKTVKFEFPSLEGKAAGKCLTGKWDVDSRLADQAAGFAKRPPGYTWHHCQDMMTMQLIPRDLHAGIGHKGGASELRDFWAALVSAAIA